MFRMKNGAHNTTNVKNTTPNTFVAFCSNRRIRPCLDEFLDMTLEFLEWCVLGVRCGLTPTGCLALIDLLDLTFLVGVDNVVRAPPKLDPLRNLLASSHVTIDAAPLLDLLEYGVEGGPSSDLKLPFLEVYPLQPLISPPGTIITSVVRRGGVDSVPKYGQVHGGGNRRPSSELRDFAVRGAGARRPSF